MKWYAINDENLARVESVMKRLYAEKTMGADDMRDLAYILYLATSETKETSFQNMGLKGYDD